MMYLHDVDFINQSDGGYDADLGEHIEPVNDSKIIACNVTDLGSERSIKLFGDVKERSIVVRVPKLIKLPQHAYIEFNDKKYTLIREIYPHDRTTLIFKEVQK